MLWGRMGMKKLLHVVGIDIVAMITWQMWRESSEKSRSVLLGDIMFVGQVCHVCVNGWRSVHFVHSCNKRRWKGWAKKLKFLTFSSVVDQKCFVTSVGFLCKYHPGFIASVDSYFGRAILGAWSWHQGRTKRGEINAEMDSRDVKENKKISKKKFWQKK